jgi:hypothetical protein
MGGDHGRRGDAAADDLCAALPEKCRINTPAVFRRLTGLGRSRWSASAAPEIGVLSPLISRGTTSGWRCSWDRPEGLRPAGPPARSRPPAADFSWFARSRFSADRIHARDWIRSRLHSDAV